MEEFDLKDNIIVYWGTSLEYYKNYKEGDVFEGKVFYSTSYAKDVAEEPPELTALENLAILEIRVPKGAKYIYIGKNTVFGDKGELLLSNELEYKLIKKEGHFLILEVVVWIYRKS